MRDLNEQIADLEAATDDLSDAAVRCRKIIIAAKVAAAGGSLALALMITGIIQFESIVLVVGIGAALGGIATYGTNHSTLNEVMAAIRLHEAARATLIDELDLRPANGDSGPARISGHGPSDRVS
jgi:hypothetical protein